jgi:hypothetical protein
LKTANERTADRNSDIVSQTPEPDMDWTLDKAAILTVPAYVVPLPEDMFQCAWSSHR